MAEGRDVTGRRHVLETAPEARTAAAVAAAVRPSPLVSGLVS